MILDDVTRKELIQLVKNAVSETIESHPLSPEEVHWVRNAITAQAEWASLRRAVIEKSVGGLIWASIVATGGWFVDYFMGHWK